MKDKETVFACWIENIVYGTTNSWRTHTPASWCLLRPKKNNNCLVVVWKRQGRSVRFFFPYIFCGFEAREIKWSQTQVFLKGQMVYYTAKVLVRNILWKITHFCLFFWQVSCFEILRMILGRKFDLFDWFEKKKFKKIFGSTLHISVGQWSTTKQYFF